MPTRHKPGTKRREKERIGILLRVVATRIRENRPSSSHVPVVGLARTIDDAFHAGHAVRGIALKEPCVGQEWAIYFEGASRRLVTSPVQRVMHLIQEGEYYIETKNSVYRLKLV